MSPGDRTIRLEDAVGAERLYLVPAHGHPLDEKAW
jgi:hypothetical protein